MSEGSWFPEAIRLARLGARELVVDYVRWWVYELPAAPFDRRTSPSLVFETEGAMRRVRDYPADWRSLTEDELYALSWSV